MKILFVTNISCSGKPYAEMIVDGEKTWEIRKKVTKIRGEIGILDKDARLLGTVDLIDIKGPFKPEEIANYTFHKSTLERLKRFSNGKQLYAWVFANAKKFDKPLKLDVEDTGTIEEVDIQKAY